MEKNKDKYINPLTDFGFKKLFGTEPNKELLIDFLNEIIPNHKVKDLTYSSNEHLGKFKVDRKAVFDIYCIGENEERFIVEMQKAKQNYFKDRSVFYSSFPIQEQALTGDWDYRLDPVYSIGILDFTFDEHKEDEEFFHLVELKNQKCEVFYEKLKFIYIELPKFTKEVTELRTRFDKWLYVFTHLQRLQDRPKELQERIFKKLFKVAEIAHFTENERKEYEESLKNYRDIKNAVETARSEGKEEGKEEGRIEGKEEGRIEGKKEGKISEKEDVVKRCLLKNMSIADIAEITDLTIEEVEKIIEDIQKRGDNQS